MTTATAARTAAHEFEIAAASFDAERLNWEKSDDHSPQPEYWIRLAAAIDAACQPQALKQFQQAAATRLVIAYLSQAPDENARPKDAIKQSWYDLRNAVDRQPTPRESLSELIELAGIQDEQIMLMTGLDRHHVAAARKALKDKAVGNAPNLKALDYPKDHVLPREREWDDRVAGEMKAWKGAKAQWLTRPKFAADQDDDWTPPPESIEELLAQGVNIPQIARMHRVSQDEVVAIRDGKTFVPDDPTAGEDDDSGPDPAMVEHEVRELHRLDPSLTPAEIEERLGVNAVRVSEILGLGKKPAKAKKK